MPQTGVHALEHAPLTSQHSIDSANVPRQRHISADNILGPHTSWQAAVSGTSSQFQRDSEETPQSPVTTTALPIPAPSSSTKKLSSEIARPRASGGMVNLMDTKPGQLLPPPESKKSRKKLIMPQEAPVSPPTSPNPHQGSPVHSPAVATDFKPFPFAPSNVSSSNPSTNDEATSNNSAAKEDIVSSVTERGQEVAEGYERPKPAPRTKGEIERNNKDATVEQKEINFRRTPSMRRGDRPR